MRSSSSWSGCVLLVPPPKNDEKWPDTWTVVSGLMVPENTRTKADPADVGGPTVAFTTSASNGASLSQASLAAGHPAG